MCYNKLDRFSAIHQRRRVCLTESYRSIPTSSLTKKTLSCGWPIKGTLFYNFISGFGLTISNPLIVFLFIALFNMFTFVIPENLLGRAVGYLSIIAGAMLWWLGLTYVIAKMKDNFGLRGILYLNRGIGSIVICSSIVYAIMTLWNLWVR